MAPRLAPIVLVLAAAACGGTPTTPAPLPQFHLSAGPHTLTVSISQQTTTNPIGITTSILFCVGSGPGSVSIPVDVSRENGQWIARPQSGTLVVRLAEVAGGVAGSIEGKAAHLGVTLIVNDGLSHPATLPATPFGGSSVGGPIDGSVRFESAQNMQSCSSNAWSLSAGPR